MALRQAGTLYYLLTDHLGSTALVTNASGGVVGQQRYYPYGTGRPTDTALPTDYRFTGQRREGTIGLYDYGTRFYDPLLGRFLSADTVVPEPGNPQALNRYSYVLNNPLKYTDPSGHAIFEENPDDPDVRWRTLKGQIVRSAHWWTAPTDRRTELRNWIDRGIRFTGATWTADHYEVVLTALDRVETALGGKTMAALGLGGGRTLTINRITTGTSRGGGGVIDLRCDGRPFEEAVEATIHEMGHIVDWHARSDKKSTRWWSDSSPEWAAATGWRRNHEYGFYNITAEGSRGAVTEYALSNPGEDFADTFTWYVESRNPGSGGFSRARAWRGEPNPARQSALMVALNTF